MKISISKEWLLKRAHLEEGLEIGAGGPFVDQSALPGDGKVAGGRNCSTWEAEIPHAKAAKAAKGGR